MIQDFPKVDEEKDPEYRYEVEGYESEDREFSHAYESRQPGASATVVVDEDDNHTSENADSEDFAPRDAESPFFVIKDGFSVCQECHHSNNDGMLPKVWEPVFPEVH